MELRPLLVVALTSLTACGGHAPGSGGGADATTGGGQADARPADAPLSIDAMVPPIDAPLSADAMVPPIDAMVPPIDAPLSADAMVPPIDAMVPPIDAMVPPIDAMVPPIDATPPPDAKIIDASPPPDASCTLGTTLTAQSPYLIHQDGATTSVTSVVTGGGPFTCAFYSGPGAGFRPTNVALSMANCTLTGGAAAGDAPGQYGFMVRVFGANGCNVDIPVAFDNGGCGPLVPVDPPVWPPRVPASPLAGYAWHTPIELVLQPTGGGGCQVCNNTRLTSNVSISSHLECASPGILCSDCNDCIEPLTSCNQGSLTMTRDVTVKPHAPIRSDGRPAWVPVTVDLLYTCTPDIWSCNMESLEL